MRTIAEVIIGIILIGILYFVVPYKIERDVGIQIKKQVERGWIVTEDKKVYAVFDAKSHESCMGCHSRVDDDRRIPKDQRCPSWKDGKKND